MNRYAALALLPVLLLSSCQKKADDSTVAAMGLLLNDKIMDLTSRVDDLGEKSESLEKKVQELESKLSGSQ